MFKSSAQLYPATDAAHNLEALLNSGLTGKVSACTVQPFAPFPRSHVGMPRLVHFHAVSLNGITDAVRIRVCQACPRTCVCVCVCVCVMTLSQDINKLVQLDTDLADVRAALKGGLSAGFVHQMLTKRISFQVVTEMLGVMPNRNTLWNNVRHRPVWNRYVRWCRHTIHEFQKACCLRVRNGHGAVLRTNPMFAHAYTVYVLQECISSSLFVCTCPTS